MKTISKVIIKNLPRTKETERIENEILFNTEKEDRAAGCLVLYNNRAFAFEPSWYNINEKMRVYPCVELKEKSKIIT